MGSSKNRFIQFKIYDINYTSGEIIMCKPHIWIIHIWKNSCLFRNIKTTTSSYNPKTVKKKINKYFR